MITSITRFATDRGIAVAVAKEQIAKHRIKHVRLSQAGYPLYSEQGSASPAGKASTPEATPAGLCPR